MKCAYCLDELDVAVTCVECQTAMHFECWDEHPQCPTLGCDVCLQPIKAPWWIQVATFFFALFMFGNLELNRFKVDLSKYYGSGQVVSNKPRQEPFRTVVVDCERTDPHHSHSDWVTTEDPSTCLPDIESIREERFKLESVAVEDLFVSYRHPIVAKTLRDIRPMIAEQCAAILIEPIRMDLREPLYIEPVRAEQCSAMLRPPFSIDQKPQFYDRITKFLSENFWLTPSKRLEWTDFELIRRRVVGLKKRKKQPPELTLLPFQTLG